MQLIIDGCLSTVVVYARKVPTVGAASATQQPVIDMEGKLILSQNVMPEAALRIRQCRQLNSCRPAWVVLLLQQDMQDSSVQTLAGSGVGVLNV